MQKNTIIGAVCLIVGIGLGAFVGASVERRRGDERAATAIAAESARAGQLAAELSQLQQRVDVTQMHLRLGRIAMEADRQDYGTAGEQATLFFDDLASWMAEPAQDGGKKALAALQQVLAARDEVIAGLATAQPATAQRLKQLYLDLFDTAKLISHRDGEHDVS